MKRGLVFTATVAALTLGLVACNNGGKSSGGKKVADVTITNKDVLQAEWFVGDSDRNLRITIADGTPVADAVYDGDLVVTSDNTSVVSIASSGLALHAEGVGAATITATYKEKKTDTVEVEVKARPAIKVVTSIDTTRTDYYLRYLMGGVSYFATDQKNEYYVKPVTLENGNPSNVSVKLDNNPDGDYKYVITIGEKVLGKYDGSHKNIGFVGEKVDDGGEKDIVKALFKFNSDYSFSTKFGSDEYFLGAYKGTSTDRLAYQQKSGTYPDSALARLVEFGDPVAATSVTLDKSALSLKVGNVAALSATVLPADTTDPLEWSVSEGDAVEVLDGTIHAVKEGTAKVKATAGSVSAECTVTVSGALNFGTEQNPITPDQAHQLLEENFSDGTQTLDMLYVRGVAESVSKTYSGSDNVTVNLRKTDGSFEAKYFTIYGALADDYTNIVADATVTAKGYAKIYNGEYEIAPGKALGAAKNTNPQIIDVVAPSVPDLTGIEISPKTFTLDVLEGEAKKQLTVSPKPARAELGTVTYTVDPADAGVTVSSTGEVKVAQTAVADDETKTFTITATCGEFSDSATLTVTKDTAGGGDTDPFETITVAEAIALNPDQGQRSDTVYIKGTIKEITNTTFGNGFIKDSDGTSELELYGLWNADKSVRYDALPASEKPVANDEVILMGKVYHYYKAASGDKPEQDKLEFENGQIVWLNGVDLTVATGIALDKTTAEVSQGSTLQLKVSTTPTGATLGEVTWTVEGNDKVTAPNGLVTVAEDAVAGSTATVKATCGEFSATCVVTVKEAGDEPEFIDATMTKGTDAYDDGTVNGHPCIKIGTSKKGGTMTITVGAGATQLRLYAAAWNGVTGLSLNITGATTNPTSIALTADSGIANNSPFTLSGSEADYVFVINLSDITTETTLTLTTSIAKRCVVWGAQYCC